MENVIVEDRNKLLEKYIESVNSRLIKEGFYPTNEQLKYVYELYHNSDKTIEEIMEEIDILADDYVENILLTRSEFERKKPIETKLDSIGITLNEQDIDLMMIANTNNLDELKNVCEKITNIRVSLPDTIADEEFNGLRKDIFDKYISSLTPKIDYLKDKSIILSEKNKRLQESSFFSEEEYAIFSKVIKNNSYDKIMTDLNSIFSPERVHELLKTLNSYTPIEKTGIKDTNITTYQNMYSEVLNKYNSVTLDEVFKYGNVALRDGTFSFDRLEKTLEFCKTNDKQVRLNTLLFYMDCPQELYNLEVNPENKEIVKKALSSYVDNVTSFIRDNGYNDTVRSIDVFNELMNRFPLEGNEPYMFRGDIPQNGQDVDDNIKSGWFKHLSIEDVCDVISIARRNLPNTDFMFNDDNLTDPRKIEANAKILSKIKDYEKKNNITLVNSIGTQMHIDNDITYDSIVSMFDRLSQFNLPIEITEFDLAMTNNVDNLSDEDISRLRDDKMKEVFSAIDHSELMNNNIRGFTIWSKTDKQNFRVTLENEIRINNNLPPITSLHGGFYSDDMSYKTKTIKQNFNYHTHTNRCGHASYESDEEYVKAARESGFTSLGFSDHVPSTNIEYRNEEQRMDISQVDEYISSINSLKNNNQDMTIIVGFEAEFDPMKEQFLGDLRNKVDYMILGQHFIPGVKQKNNPNYPLLYADMVCMAMDSGIFDIVAHPDIFMQYRDTMKTKDNKALFMQNALKASNRICEKAKDLGIPLELNLNGAQQKRLSDGEYPYPHSLFWKIASNHENKALFGVDAHYPNQFLRANLTEKRIGNLIDLGKIEFVSKDYNPVNDRKNNIKLQELLEDGQQNAYTYETNLAGQIIDSIFSKVNDGDLGAALQVGVEQIGNGISKELSAKKNELNSYMTSISDNKKLSSQEKTFKLNNTKNSLGQIVETNTARGKLFGLLQESVSLAIDIGCNDKESLKNTVMQNIELNTTKNPERKNEMLGNINSTNNKNKDSQSTAKNKPVTYTKNNSSSKPSNGNSNGGSSSNNGYVDSFSISMIVAFGILFVCALFFYMIYS